MDPIMLSLVIGGAILLAAGGKKKKTRTAPPPTQEEDTEAETKPQPNVAKDDRDNLEALGYGFSKSEVREFQKDFNVVQDVYGIWDRKLVVDGIIGVNTRGAIARALEYKDERGEPWLDIVYQDAMKKLDSKYTLTANDKGNLESLGYFTAVKGVVARFQRDFNGVNLWLPQPMLPMTLAEDGIIGPNTREAIAVAQQTQINRAEAWMDMVYESGARDQA